MWRVVVSLALASCYRPNEVLCEVVTCDPFASASCPGGLTCQEGQCVAPGQPLCGGEPPGDAAPGCVLTQYAGQVCPPMGQVPESFDVPSTVDTTTCALPFTPLGTICYAFAEKVAMSNVRATGERTLMLIGRSGISITGTLDVGSHFGDADLGAGSNAGCLVPGSPGSGGIGGAGNGGGGGAGGSYQGPGGEGGTGETSIASAAGGAAGSFGEEAMRGGCDGGLGGAADGAGGGGNRGHGGGGVYLVSLEAIGFDSALAKILAGGSGGGGGSAPAGGGGGGGAGGSIILEAPNLRATGAPTLCANGGGGGAGGGAGNGGVAQNGDGGVDACMNGMITRVSGGASAQDGTQGDGGNGSSVTNVQGEPAVAGDGGGGGGGGAGYIVFFGAHDPAVLGTLVSPHPTIRPRP